MKILICENEEILLTALEFRLRKNGYELSWAKNGEEGLQKFTEEKPNLLITSLDLPKIAGIDLVKQIRSENKKTPIVVIGELEQQDVIMEALQSGVTDFLTKPFKPVELVLRVQHILNK